MWHFGGSRHSVPRHDMSPSYQAWSSPSVHQLKGTGGWCNGRRLGEPHPTEQLFASYHRITESEDAGVGECIY